MRRPAVNESRRPADTLGASPSFRLVTDPTLARASSLAIHSAEPDALADAWPRAHVMRLTGWLERNGFHPLLAAFLVFILAFVLFQLVISPLVIGIGIAIDLVQSGQTEPPTVGDLMEQLTTNLPLLMTANTVGQIGGFGLLAWAVARLHTPQAAAFLRVRRPDPAGLGLAAVGWACLYPAVIWTGQLNRAIPLPEPIRVLEQSQIDMIEGLLMGNELSLPFLFLALALTPAICEELLFRGYLQRQVERGWGTVASIAVVGVLFGLYHLRLSQAIPLSLLGVYLGFVVWATGSVWAGVLVHLLNNGLAVAAAGYARSAPDVDLEAIEAAGVPWYFGVAGLVLAGLVARVMAERRIALAGTEPDSLPVAALPPASTPLL